MNRTGLPILLIIVSIALFYMHIDPRYQKAKALNTERQQYDQALVKAGELKNVAAQLLGQYNSISQDNLLRLERLVPDNLNTVKLVADINSIAGKYGIALKAIRVTEKTADASQQVVTDTSGPKYNTTTIFFSFEATYENLSLFMIDLEKSLQIIDVRSITFNAVTAKSGLPYEYTVAVQTYWLK